MNFNLETQSLFDILTSHPWDSGIGRKMLFLRRRYYVFDDEHKLLDGGVIRYNPTLEKIFIRNEDLRGEVFVSQAENGNIKLKGSVSSKLAGLINIDNLLHPYDKELNAPLSSVTKIEKYLKNDDIFKVLYRQEEPDAVFLRNFKKNLLFFTPEQAKQLYIKLSQRYFQTLEPMILKSISLYFSSYPIDDQLYEELFMFLMTVQTHHKNHLIQNEEIDFFIGKVKKRLLNSYQQCPSTISINLINECLLYFHLHSPELPTPQECVQKLYDKKLHIQKEYAYYLALMPQKVTEVETEIYHRLLGFYYEQFYAFKQVLYLGTPAKTNKKKIVSERDTLLALIEALGNCKSDNEEIHLFFIFLLSSHEKKVKVLAKRGLLNCKEKVLNTLNRLNLSEKKLKDQILNIINEKEL